MQRSSCEIGCSFPTIFFPFFTKQRASRIVPYIMCWNQNKVTEQYQHIAAGHPNNENCSSNNKTSGKQRTWAFFLEHRRFCPCIDILPFGLHFSFPVSVLSTSRCHVFLTSWLGIISYFCKMLI